MRNRYVNRWGTIKQIKVPNSLFNNGIQLSSAALAVFLVLLQTSKHRYIPDHSLFATVKAGHGLLHERTGYSPNSLSRAIKQLHQSQIIEPNRTRKKHKQFGATEYVLCNPDTGLPFDAQRDVVLAHKVSYFTFPECVITESTANWSLSKLSSSELKLYTAILYLANRARNNEFTTAAAEARKVSSLETATLRKAMGGLEDRGLVWFSKTDKGFRVQLCDPYTGIPLPEWDPEEEDNPANYFTTGSKGQSKRVNLNLERPRANRESSFVRLFRQQTTGKRGPNDSVPLSR